MKKKKLLITVLGPSQRMEGLCGGYPGSCYPTLNYKDEQQIKVDIYEKNPCVTSTPCQNGGVCAATDLKLFTCLCQGGFAGDYCETIEGKLFCRDFVYYEILKNMYEIIYEICAARYIS